MRTPARRLVLREWELQEATKEESELSGLFIEQPEIALAAESLERAGMLRLRNNRYGLSVQARQYVGIVQLGPLQVVVQPKLPPDELWHILAYGLELDTLRRHLPAELSLPDALFTDLLALALKSEAESLLRRRLRHGYHRRQEWLSAPHGRIDMARLASALPLTEAALPCDYSVMSADILENRVIRAGLRLAAQLASTPAVRAALLDAERRWEPVCSRSVLDFAILRQVERSRTRLTAAYEPAHRLVSLVYGGSGLPDDLADMERGRDRIPGFLWNMEHLFERFVTRFLQEHLEGLGVRAQESIHDLYRVVSAPDPQKQAPKPRPDLLVMQGETVIAVLDTKYRDFWPDGLTQDSLYQMSVYALAYSSEASASWPPAIVLYPAEENRKDIVYALRHGRKGRESLLRVRAVDWATASRAMRDGSRRSELARIAGNWASVGVIATQRSTN